MNENNSLDPNKIAQLKFKIFQIETKMKTKNEDEIKRELKAEIERIVNSI
jgi:hypothetical protein